ncbi:MAG TPA: PQQ-binding-like beta-propeller repeat protein [Planctomycetota bacterium]|jgi:outer membrane protein assembly factor BamB/tetratricopeptide (TPR) repeat protein|nr:PQQ-binding-like beta-propeller repeat protein [Planctomycetota bacterium]OQC20247.1 MAG: Outer membrane protein assembly factor BamB [Planctomycetes bacterium ADurb.Bin069]HNR99229.1 PQQ-binding-like beta-propeller repeat protein [Planctomycetota bacterium]HNU27093.1 PQQ-binding-like beta-propeller repeat protein [Planctomycetota bacterium]HOE30642.1 PQQ-binding-like beta-propeller repeat protein [Planctomycetota bacterium]
MDARCCLIAIALAAAASWIHGQQRARVFFPVDDNLQTLGEEIEDLVAAENFTAARDRLNELLAALSPETIPGPVARASTHAASPWEIIGAAWPRLPESLRGELRQKIEQRLARGGASLAMHVCEVVPDAALRAASALPLALRCLEEGRFAEAERCAALAEDAGASAAASRVRAMAERFLRPDAPPAAPSADPEIDRIRERLLAENEAARHGTRKHGPWIDAGAPIMPGSLAARHVFPHRVSAYKSAINAAFPAIVDTLIYAFNGETVAALMRDSPAPLWTRPWPGAGRELRNTLLAPAADGERVFIASAGVVAAFARKDGAPLWTRFVQTDAAGSPAWASAAPAAPPAVHLTPPLCAAGKVFVGINLPARQHITAHVAAFAPEDGALLWTAKAGTMEGADILGLGSSPLPLASHGDRVYFCPNLGFLAALDAERGAVAYLRTYTRLDLLAGEYAIRGDSRWQLAPLVVWDRMLLAAPQDSSELIGFDARQGGILLRIAREDGGYFLGPYRDRLFVIGATVRALSILPGTAGETLFNIALPTPPAGRGQIIDNLLAVPCRDRLVFLALDDGRALSTHLWEAQPGGGNIAAAPWGMVVAHTQGIDIYRDINEDAAEIDTMRSENDVRRLKRARLALKTRDFATAIGELASFPALSAPFSTPRELAERSHVCRLIEAWTAMDIPIATKTQLCRARAEIAPTEAEALAALLAEGEFHELAGDAAQALRAYYGALGHAGDLALPVAWGLSADAATYLTERIAAVLAKREDREVLRSEFNAAAQVRLHSARKARHPDALRAVRRSWPFTVAGEQAHLDAAELYLSNQNSPAAVEILTEYLRAYPEGRFAADALALLGRIYESAGQTAKARAAYETLAAGAAGAALTLPGGARVDAAAWARERAAACPPAQDVDDEASLRLPLKIDWFTRRDLFDRPDALRLLPAQLDPEALCVLGEEFLRVYDKKLGTLRYAVETPARTLAAAVVGAGPARTLVIAGAREIRGAPFHRGEPERFRLTLAAPDEPESFLQDVHFGPHTFTTLAGTALRAFDAAGTQLWECTLPSRARAPLCACGNALAAFAASGGAIWIIDADTGRLSAQLSSETADKRVSAPPIPAGPGEALAIYGRELCLVDTTAAAVRWRRRLDDVAPAEARFFPDSPETLFVWGRTPAQGWRLEIIDRAHGGTRWHRDFPGDAPILDVVPSRDDAVVLCGDTARSMLALRHEAGETKELWRRRLYDSFDAGLPLIIAGGSVMHGDREANRVLAVSLARGNIQTEGLSAVRRFLAGRRLRDYGADHEALYILADGALARFVFQDLYRPRVTKEALVLDVLAAEHDLAAQFALGRSLLTGGEPHAALGFLSGILWDRWPLPAQAEPLWQLLGAAQEESARAGRAMIRCAPAPAGIEIDGVLNEEWPLATAVTLDRPASIMAVQSPSAGVPPWSGPNDLSAKFFCAWDSECFYFALDVRDNIVLFHDSEAAAWVGDCLIIEIDPEGDGGLYASRGDRMFTLFLTVQPPQPNRADDKPLTGRYKLKVSEDNTGVVYECAVRWDDLGFDGVSRAAAPGTTFGFNLVVVDDDTGAGALQALSLNASHAMSAARDRVWESYVPDFFPRIVLEDGAGVAPRRESR